ncbi:hypothetical protein [Streptosporangium sp. NPDC051022]|uniref:hypothetical protein n=1 Tax=Streptosporangium sp. NPDC051022 TaxID=3155752 RepID=UPI0034219BAD
MTDEDEKAFDEFVAARSTALPHTAVLVCGASQHDAANRSSEVDRPMRSLALSTAVVSTMVALSVALAPAAGAAPSPSASPAGRTGQTPPAGKPCVTHLTTDPSTNGRVSCYDTFTEAIADATGGRITDAPRDGASAVADPAFGRRINALAQANGRPAAQASEFVIGIEYVHANYDGGYLIFAAGAPCDDDNEVEWRLPYLDSGFNDKISSFESYSDCEANHYEHFEYGGSSTGWRGHTSYIGSAMNDQTSSIEWR